MLIDWFTVAAQIVNFLVLAALLKRFLYGRIVKAMDQREEKIAERLRDAEAKKREAEEELDLYRRKQEELDGAREKMLADMHAEVEEKRKELMRSTRDEVQGVKAGWFEALREEQESFFRSLRETLCDGVYKASRRVLADLAGADLEQRMVERFIHKLRREDGDWWRKAAAPEHNREGSIKVLSAFEISEGLRRSILEVVQNQFGDGADVEFELSPDLICGIELKLVDHKISWNIADYLESLEEGLAEDFKQHAGESTDSSGLDQIQTTETQRTQG